MPSPALTALLAPAFAQAQGLLGDALTIDGVAYTGTFGQPRPQQQMLPGGGYRGRTVIALTLTRDQFNAAPTVRGTVMKSGISYRIDTVDVHDPFHYVLQLVRLGE